MPVITGRDSKGSWMKWGGRGKKYYYIAGNKRSRDLARDKAKRQGMSIHASGWKG